MEEIAKQPFEQEDERRAFFFAGGLWSVLDSLMMAAPLPD